MQDDAASGRGSIQALAPMSINEASRDICDRAFELTDCFTIWWDLSDKSNEATHKHVIQAHGNYFSAIIHALLQGFAVVAYQLFETRQDTHSVPSLLRELEGQHAFDGSALRQQIEVKRPVLSKAFALRNKVFAHRIAAETPQAVFTKAGITPDEMQELVHLAQWAVGELVEASGWISREAFLSRCKHRESLAREQSQAVMGQLGANRP